MSRLDIAEAGSDPTRVAITNGGKSEVSPEEQLITVYKVAAAYAVVAGGLLRRRRSFSRLSARPAGQ
jgi:hypothetical protein